MAIATDNNIELVQEPSVFDRIRDAVMDYVYGDSGPEDLQRLHDIEFIIREAESDMHNLEEDRDRYMKWWREAYVKLDAYKTLVGEIKVTK